MKKFIKTSLLLTALLTSPLVSCSKDNKNNKTDNKTEVAKVEVTGVSLLIKHQRVLVLMKNLL